MKNNGKKECHLLEISTKKAKTKTFFIISNQDHNISNNFEDCLAIGCDDSFGKQAENWSKLVWDLFNITNDLPGFGRED